MVASYLTLVSTFLYQKNLVKAAIFIFKTISEEEKGS